jgi:hypothetical protein
VEESIIQTAQSKRVLEKLVIHKNKFKGKKYVGDDGEKDLEHLIEEARAIKGSGAVRKYDEPDLERLLTRDLVAFSDDFHVRGARVAGSRGLLEN